MTGDVEIKELKNYPAKAPRRKGLISNWRTPSVLTMTMYYSQVGIIIHTMTTRSPEPRPLVQMITGRQVFLRTPRRNDLKEFTALNRESAWFHRGLVSPPTDGTQFFEYLERCNRSDTASFFICGKADRAIAGAINLSQIFRGAFQNAYLGYFIGAPFAGKGYGTEAVQLILRHAFKELHLHRIEANIQPGNIASVALVKRAGFVQEGYSRRYLKIAGKWRDHERWAIIAEDWQPLALKKSGARK